MVRALPLRLIRRVLFLALLGFGDVPCRAAGVFPFFLCRLCSMSQYRVPQAGSKRGTVALVWALAFLARMDRGQGDSRSAALAPDHRFSTPLGLAKNIAVFPSLEDPPSSGKGSERPFESDNCARRTQPCFRTYKSSFFCCRFRGGGKWGRFEAHRA